FRRRFANGERTRKHGEDSWGPSQSKPRTESAERMRRGAHHVAVRRFLALAGALLLLTALGPAAAARHSRHGRKDTKPPSFHWRGITPELLLRDGPVHLLYRGSDQSATLHVAFTIRDADGNLVASVNHLTRPHGRASVSWRAEYGNGTPVLPGLYRAQVTLTDQSGNSTTGPPRPFRVLRRVHTRVFRRIDGAGRRVALTFDDCNDGRAWARMLHV